MRWRHYIPSFLSISLAFFMLMVPALAVFLVFGALMTFGLAYAFLIRKIHQSQDAMRSGEPIDVPYREVAQDPSFRNVSVHIFRQRF